MVAGGLTVTSNISVNNTSIGTITSSPVSIPGGQSDVTTQFQPNSSGSGGSATISADVPSGFSPPASSRRSGVQNTISPACRRQTMASLSETICRSRIPSPWVHQPGRRPASEDHHQQLRSLVAVPRRAQCRDVFPHHHHSARCDQRLYYLQSLGNSGTVSYTASATRFRNLNASLTLSKSGLVIWDRWDRALQAPTYPWRRDPKATGPFIPPNWTPAATM